ncbi:MAG: TonB-dependent receptor domain-containing protein, partial [bacterium]
HDKLRLKIHLSHLTGFPSLRQLYNENPDETDHSNKNLKPTISKNYETTVQYDPNLMMRIMVTAFYTRAQDLVGTVRLPPPTHFRFENITSARLTGIEIFAKGKVNNFISFFVTYAYNDSRDLSTSEPLEHSVYNRGGAGVNLSFWRFKPIVLLEFRSKEIIRESSGNMGYLKGYSKLDTGLEFTMWRNNSVFVYIENVTDKIYFIAENMEGEPRSIRAGLNISY